MVPHSPLNQASALQPHRDQILRPTRPSAGNSVSLDRGICSKLRHGRMRPTSKRTLRLESDATPTHILHWFWSARPLDHSRHSEFAFSSWHVPTGLDCFNTIICYLRPAPIVTHIYPNSADLPWDTLISSLVYHESLALSHPRPLCSIRSVARRLAVSSQIHRPLHSTRLLFACSFGPFSAPVFLCLSSNTRKRPWPTLNPGILYCIVRLPPPDQSTTKATLPTLAHPPSYINSGTSISLSSLPFQRSHGRCLHCCIDADFLALDNVTPLPHRLLPAHD